MTKATVGRVVWYYVYIAGQGHKGPLAAHVSYVHSDELVNLMVINENGIARPETGVPLVQEGKENPASSYCCWMPYQIGQAQKAEQLQGDLDRRRAVLEAAEKGFRS